MHKSPENANSFANINIGATDHNGAPQEILSESLLKIYQPALSRTKTQLCELNEKQIQLEEEIHQQNLKLSEAQFSEELDAMFNKIKTYQNKLVVIKKNMKHLHDRSLKLKNFALKLQPT